MKIKPPTNRNTMKFLTIDASKSINPNTGEAWYRAEIKVSVDDSENPEQVFQELKNRIDGWLPNPFQKSTQIREDGSEKDVQIAREFEETKKRINEAKTKAAAGQILVDSGFKLNLELQMLVNLKPE